MPRGNFGEIRAFQDFLGSYEDVTWTADVDIDLNGGWFAVSVNEGTIQNVVDEEGGIVQFLTDTGDNDAIALVSGPFKPSNGGCVTEARFKIADDLNVAVFAGFSETLDTNTPVMPAEYASTTMTINGSGGVAGLQYDLDGSNPDVFRPASGDGGAVTGTNKSGTAITATTTTSSGQTVTADKFVVARVEISPSGRIDYLLAADKELTLVESITGAVNADDMFFAVLMLENREAAAKEFEVDYVYARGFRDWTA